ncbi:2-C-methyl-D-erythritol 4-phosphate cytidylyltransferase [Candidatus Hartigia pinicola]|nr:2-C-methyl-D-erythritol 4-phosphate cytidylyltransferase [Candidatus Hartigia pinicola]
MNHLSSNTHQQVVAIVAAAGVGSRMHAYCPKQYLQILGKTIIEYSIEALLLNPKVALVVVVLSPTDDFFFQLNIAKNLRIVTINGGRERADSVLAGLNFLFQYKGMEEKWVLVHDAVRPCLYQDDLNKLIQLATTNCCGGILAAPVRDTIKRRLYKTNVIDYTVQRESLWYALTPQFFPLMLLWDCLTYALKDKTIITDEASALEFCGYQPTLVPARLDNLKVTLPEDLALAEFYLSRMK